MTGLDGEFSTASECPNCADGHSWSPGWYVDPTDEDPRRHFPEHYREPNYYRCISCGYSEPA